MKCLYALILLCLLSIQTSCSDLSNNSKKTTVMQQNLNTLNLSDEEWSAKLSDEEYYILREKGTEKPFSGKFLLHKENGYYTCRGCGERLFKSDAKFDAHCGWPSFDKEIEKGKITYTQDNSHGMQRVEITCSKCGSHLGHVFNDGPTETGLRYCVNSVSLEFEHENTVNNIDTMTIGGGCFWCTEAVYSRIKGVLKVEPGYAGGHTENPTYKEVCTGNTGHAEVIQLTYNTAQISFIELLNVFFATHNPTTLNRQGNDVGTQYRSVIFYHNQQQKVAAEKVIQALVAEKIYDKPIITEITPFTKFYKAEDYHHNYFVENSKTNSYCEIVIQPKVEKFEKVFRRLLKNKE